LRKTQSTSEKELRKPEVKPKTSSAEAGVFGVGRELPNMGHMNAQGMGEGDANEGGLKRARSGQYDVIGAKCLMYRI